MQRTDFPREHPNMTQMPNKSESANKAPAGSPPGAGGPPPGVAGPPPGAGGPLPGVAGPPPGLDPVSGALNLPAFAMAFTSVVSAGEHDDFAMWFVDIRNFRSVNPKHGFMKGNLVLRAVARGMKEVLAHDLPVARLGGDRFIMLTADLDYEQAEKLFKELLVWISDDLSKQGINENVVLSAGIYYLRDEDYKSANHQNSLDYSSIAHRNARENPSSVLVRFTDEDLERDRRRIAIEQSIDDALADGQIQVWYQPQFDYTYGDVVGAEALARWKHPTLGWISPAEFIPALENCGKIHELDLFVWEEACRNAGRWRSMSDGKPVPISVNVSRAEMFEPGLLEHFIELRTKYDLPKGSLHLEITESAFVEEADRLYGIINQMREHDMLVEMDDFGSGLSSLNMLKDVPVDVVKLDMGFMRNAMNEDRGGVVLGSVIRMLQGLNTPIIAEGVETLEQAEMLKNMGCRFMQGFHFSRPMPLVEFEDFVASNRAVDKGAGRQRYVAHLDELMSFDESSSFLFNHAVGGIIYFFITEGSTESILVNDQFYEDCGLERGVFGNRKIDPIAEIADDTRATMWRAAAEAREYGTALCTGRVKRTERIIDCVIRFIGPSNRGDIYSLNILRSRAKDNARDIALDEIRDLEWGIDLLSKIVPSGFVKCACDEDCTIIQISPELVKSSGLTRVEFTRAFHNSMLEAVVPADRIVFLEAIVESKSTGKTFDCDVRLWYGHEGATRRVRMMGRVLQDERNGFPLVYILVTLLAEPTLAEGEEGAALSSRVIKIDYTLHDDRLVIHRPSNGKPGQDVVIEHCLESMEGEVLNNITRTGAAMVLATMRDIRSHPTPGFVDVKCNLSGGDELRWYHINYTCDVDDEGNTTTVHGFAQDANDQMGSVRWWRRQAVTDHLTGLLNRNAVEREMNLSMRTQGSGLMFMIDLDGFKRINDELGHLEGDELLRGVANAISSQFRESDVVGRYGGDEFVAFMPLVNGDAASLAARRAQSIIDAVHTVVSSDGSHAACSVGVAISHDRAATFYDLLEVADKAMYEAKMAGKGCFTIMYAE